ncbi:MAG TPA: OmpA family protein [Rhodanobacteraceae bacterium]|nr:OmpA family protein [Rhodanobacteraceae bacterium]
MSITLRPLRASLIVAALATVALGGCTQYVKKADYDLAMQQLQQKDQQLQNQIDSIKQDMATQFSALDAKVTAMQGRIDIDTVAHFAYDDASLREQDKPALAAFANTMTTHHGAAIITVEGFADPAGSRAFNQKLGQQRADAVRDFLVANGMNAAQVRAVSYGESRNRQIDPGASHDAGERNRRASVSIDFAG